MFVVTQTQDLPGLVFYCSVYLLFRVRIKLKFTNTYVLLVKLPKFSVYAAAVGH